MKHKLGNTMIIFLLTVMFLVLTYTILTQESDHTLLSFEVTSEHGEKTETIKLWFNEDNTYYVFLPSYISLSDITIKKSSERTIYIDNILVENGKPLEIFSLEGRHELRVSNVWSDQTYQLEFLQSANVATMYIQNATGSMNEVYSDKNHKEPVSISIYNDTGELNYNGSSDIIKGRGNSTWLLEKKPFNLELSEPANLLDMGESCNWALLANSYDESNLRNKMIYDFAGKTKLEWTPQCKYVDLYLNGEYNGLYLLSEKIEFQENRLNYSEENIYLCALEFQERFSSLNNSFLLESGQAIEIKIPDECSDEQFELISNKVQGMENAIMADDGIDPDSGISWEDYIDLDSWVRKYLIDEIFENTDEAQGSSYFYWTENDSAGSGKIYGGLIWDYDKICGSDFENSNPNALFATRIMRDSSDFIPWYNILCQKDKFYERVVEIYHDEFLPLLQQEINTEINTQEEQIIKASELNKIRWEKMFEELEYLTGQTAIDGADIKDFLQQRILFLNGVWFEGKKYCTIYIERMEDTTYVLDSVEYGDQYTELPDPEELKIDNFVAWYDASTGKEYDTSQAVVNDIMIYAVTEPKTYLFRHIWLNKETVYAWTSCLILLSFFLVMVKIDYNRNYRS